ncbi:family 2 glycosyl transferase [Myxococcus stipitatus DSM 14675]|uniref:Family 2 glycosyl transferase n=1 Tax=Myxococcus stipitatus (strain DSM 14675 / JCM 12634 / Mx s8) TaxID=1278073 RepID=L7UDN6_MYXSD|nr:glycosyltransferase [Myxococcus stipitatus]AGC47026.1 family 2 glycosyl transferase [Myxococcus stipitatus DSM 14675]
MRICLVSKELSPFFGGGIGTYVALMSRAFADAGHEVHVLTAPHPGLERAPVLLPGVRVHTVAELEPGYAGAFPFPPLRHAMAAYTALQSLHAQHPFDLIEFPEYEGEGYFALRARRTLGQFATAVLAVRLHTPTHEVQHFNRVTTLDMDAAQQEFMEDCSIRDADLLLSPTQSLLDLVRARLGLGDEGVVVPHPFPTSSFAPPTARPRAEPPRVLYFGRLEYRKGVQHLIEAMQLLFARGLQAEVQLVGGDTRTGPFGRSMREWLERRIAPEWKHRFHFEAPRPRDELAAIISEATVCCFPSLWENFPNVCLEAMSAGCLVVGGDAGGMAEVIQDGRSGLLFRAGDSKHLAEVLERALTTPSLQQAVRDAAPARIADYCQPASIVRQVEAAVAAHPPRLPTLRPPPKAHGSTPRVTFLVPYFNMGRYLPETLRSIRAQTFTDYEILVVDDGSTDPHSRALLETLDAPDLRIISKQNGGLSSARNAGLKEARGHYVLPLDADDLLQPTFLEKAIALMEGSRDFAFVTSLVSYFIDDPARVVGGWAPWGVERDALWVFNVASTCTALMERRHVEEVGGYDEWLTAYEDWDVFCSLAERGLSGTVIPEPLFQYRLRPDSMTRTTVVTDRYAVMAYLYQKHPSLALHPERSLRILQGEAHKQQQLAARSIAPTKPLLHQVADRVNEALKQQLEPFHPALRRTAQWLLKSGPEDSRPLRYQLMEKVKRLKPPGR